MAIDRQTLRIPELDPPYDEALRQAVDYLDDRYDIEALIACGTIIRGAPDPSSDLDLYVVNREPFRQRVQRFFNGVPAEIFVNPEFQVRSYFAEEKQDARPITAHMLATGFVMYDPDATIASLRREGLALLADPPAAPINTIQTRHMIAAMYEDAIDVIDRDPHTARLFLHNALWQTLIYFFRVQPVFVPRTKDLLSTLRDIDPELHGLVTDAMNSHDAMAAAESIGRFLDAVIGVRGFFEWETGVQQLSPPSEGT